MGGPQDWMEQCDVVCMNRYWGWYTLGGQLAKARQGLEAELDQVWDRWHKPIIMTEFGADTVPGFHGKPDVMWTPKNTRPITSASTSRSQPSTVAGMQGMELRGLRRSASLAASAASTIRVCSRVRTPKMAAHVLREFWVK